MTNQNVDGIRAARGSGEVERCDTGRGPDLRICPAGKQSVQRGGVARPAREVERGVAPETRRCCHVCTGVQKHLDHRRVVVLCCPVQSAHTVALSGVHVSSVSEEKPNTVEISFLSRIRDRRICPRCTEK
jgi:hypothetical protein